MNLLHWGIPHRKDERKYAPQAHISITNYYLHSPKVLGRQVSHTHKDAHVNMFPMYMSVHTSHTHTHTPSQSGKKILQGMEAMLGFFADTRGVSEYYLSSFPHKASLPDTAVSALALTPRSLLETVYH